MFAVENYLMANRGTESFADFSHRVTQLTTETLAYSLADDDGKAALVGLFIALAQYIEGREAALEKQAQYAKTLLGVEAAQKIESWTSAHREILLSLDSNEALLTAAWPILAKHSQNDFFTSVLPESLPVELARMWLQGQPYKDLHAHAVAVASTKPWGTKRRHIKDNDIIEFCESTLGFECPLIIGAVTQFSFSDPAASESNPAPFLLFHKALKYGIPDVLAISCYESGFADRMLAQVLRDAILNDGYTGPSFTPAMVQHREKMKTTLSGFPSYFESVLSTIG